MKADIAAVAEAAGVSKTTASMALNGKGRVSPTTRERVLKAAKRLGYRGNAVARSLRTGVTKLIGIQIAYSSGSGVIPETTYFARLLDGASKAALDRGWVVVVIPWTSDLSIIGDLDISAGIIVDPIGNEPLLKKLATSDGFISCVGRFAVGRNFKTAKLNFVDNDIFAVVKSGLTHLLDAGYQRPALLTSDVGVSYVDDSIRAFRKLMSGHHSKPMVKTAPRIDNESATRVARKMLRRAVRPDAIYTTNEEGVLGVLAAARELRLKVPEDLGIVAALDSPLLAHLDPSITTIDLFPERLGSAAVQLLVDNLEGRVESTRALLEMPFELKVRGSTKR